MTKSKSIMVIEDDNDIRETLRQLLDLEGYQVFTAANGKEGLDQLAKIHPPSLILLDLMMPVMNGWQFIEAQKSDNRLSTIPVLVVTAAGEKNKDLGAAGFIKKPIEIDNLLDIVKQYCD